MKREVFGNHLLLLIRQGGTAVSSYHIFFFSFCNTMTNRPLHLLQSFVTVVITGGTADEEIIQRERKKKLK